MDDYGHGYSNISFLLELPFGYVKLDKKIAMNIGEDNRFLSALVPMFKTLDKIIVAEGVETLQQAQMLLDLGCDAIQGFYYASPMPMSEAIAFYKQRNV